ncbi:hypothetical protein [Hellea balneolensis]|uniref:hypothetical protein n=1 Tax=Hellea balneolensis TaxID=287478 RepID=UPI0003F55FAF|nr:hypothetical protein [Hellea balneolensis]
MIKTLKLHTLALLGAFMVPSLAAAQNTGGVFPPMVNDGHKSAQYRIAINPDNAAGETGFAQRLHYQQSLNGDMMWRVVGQTRKTADSDFDFDFLQAELFWELSDDEDQHKTGLRFDARLRDEGRAEQLGLNWTNQFNFENGWSARALILTAVQIGENAADGVNLQTRGQIARKMESGHTLGVDMFNNYVRTGNIGSFKEQSHTIGPFVAAPLGDGVSLYAGPLFGLSKAAPDLEARLWLTRGF